jgi:pimeloyl-ACP methyl ester carboxylesterase
MRRQQLSLLSALLIAATALVSNRASAASASLSARVVDLKASDGTILKASYFAAAKPGPAVMLFHQTNRTRKTWDEVAAQLAAAGINTLTLDMRGFGESGGTPHDKLAPKERSQVRKQRPADIDIAWQYLVSQPGVNANVIGLGGAGLDGVENSIETASRHSAQVKSLVLLSGQTELAGRQFLRQASQLPGLFVWADNDDYPPTAEVMEWLYGISPNPGKKYIHYAGQEAPWLGYESADVAATGSHGTDLFKVHPELPSIIVDWFVTTLLKTPGQVPVNNSGPPGSLSMPILDQIETPGGAAQVAQQLLAVRQKDPQAQLWPRILVNVMGYDNMQAGNPKLALDILKLNALAYPESADANDSLSDAYLANGEKDLAREYAEKALALLASDTKESEARRDVIRESAQQKLKQLTTAH